jgi:hypothetical protein
MGVTPNAINALQTRTIVMLRGPIMDAKVAINAM